MSEKNAVQLWAWVTCMQENPTLQKYHLKANESLTFALLDSQHKLLNPKTVCEALTFALQHSDRLENGSELAVKADERLVRESQEKKEHERLKQEETDKLSLLAAQNEVFALCREISEFRGGSDPNIVAQELKRIHHWNLTQLREYKAGMERARAAKGLSAAEYKQQLAAERPVQHTNGYPALPEKWNRTAIRTAPVQTLRTLMQRYGRKQLDARLQMEES